MPLPKPLNASMTVNPSSLLSWLTLTHKVLPFVVFVELGMGFVECGDFPTPQNQNLPRNGLAFQDAARTASRADTEVIS